MTICVATHGHAPPYIDTENEMSRTNYDRALEGLHLCKEMRDMTGVEDLEDQMADAFTQLMHTARMIKTYDGNAIDIGDVIQTACANFTVEVEECLDGWPEPEPEPEYEDFSHETHIRCAIEPDGDSLRLRYGLSDGTGTVARLKVTDGESEATVVLDRAGVEQLRRDLDMAVAHDAAPDTVASYYKYTFATNVRVATTIKAASRHDAHVALSDLMEAFTIDEHYIAGFNSTLPNGTRIDDVDVRVGKDVKGE